MANTPKKVIETESKITNDTDPTLSLRTKIKAAHPEIQHYVMALEAENLKIQRQIGKMQAENVTLNSRIIILEENTNERCVHETPPYECLQKKQELLEEEIAQLKELKATISKTK